jgi:DNA-binding response OmpR family regulator
LTEGKKAAASVRGALESEHYPVDVASEPDDAIWLAGEHDYDLAIIDVDLQVGWGLETLRRARTVRPSLPLLVVVNSADATERARLLNLGADDCITKPFSYCEFSARVHALLRRPRVRTEGILRVSDLELNRLQRTVMRAGCQIELTSREFALLEYFMLNAGRPLTRVMILDRVWGVAFDTLTNLVDVYVYYLRQKVDKGHHCCPVIK